MRSQYKKILTLLGSLLTLVTLPIACDAYFSWHYRHMATPLINWIEQYHKVTGRYPKNAAEMGYDDSEIATGPFYQLLDSTHYTIFYTDGAGSNYIYDSKTEQWASTTQ